MSTRKKLMLLVSAVALLGLPISLLQAQRGPGPGPWSGPGGGFGWGPENGVRVLGAGGCFFEERGLAKKSSDAYSLSVVRSETRAVLSGTPTPHTENYTVVHDVNGVTYVETTRNSKTLVCVNDPANHVRYLVTLTAPNTGTALEFKEPPKPPRFGNGQPPQGQNPPRKPNPDVTRFPNVTLAQVLADVPAGELPPSPFVPASAWASCTTFDVTLMTHGKSQNARVFCSTLGVNLYTLMSDPFMKSTVAATITVPPGTVTPPLTYPFPGTITVTVFKGGPRGRGPRGPQPPPQG
jgi:hypothetical protein